MLACIFTPMKVHRSDGMNPVDIIVKKRDGHELSRQEIEFFVQGLTAGRIPDYQVAAWAMTR